MKANHLLHVHILVATLSMALLSTVCYSEEKPARNTTKENESYSVGYSFGRLINSQRVEYDIDQLVAGTRDAYGGKDSRLPEEEMKAILKELEKKIYVSVQKMYQENIVSNLKAGEEFLRENSKKEGIVILPGGLQYKVVKEGSGPTPTIEDDVVINYRGTLINGTEFDGSYSKGKPETVSMKAVIPGLTEALKKMKVGAKWQIFVPPSMGYGLRGLEKRIPPNSTLIFEIELISIEKAEALSDTEETHESVMLNFDEERVKQ